ncbi:MAG: 4Fe-4S dicluster domain-containing protein [Planctomycetota bacterium]
MARYGMAIDLSKCLGCGACALACKTENNTEFEQDGRKYNWADFLTFTEGTFAEGNLKSKVMPVLCNHCTNAPCVTACPVNPKAMYKNADGITLHNDERCIGCQFCQSACPYSSKDVNADGVQYSVITYNPKTPDTQSFYDDATAVVPDCTSTPAETAGLAGTRPPDKNEYTHPDYNAVRPSNVTEKCIFCHHRLQNGESPYCVVSCPSGARVFGDLDDPQSEINQLLIAHGYDRLANNSGDMLGGKPGTDPNVFYVGDFGPGK